MALAFALWPGLGLGLGSWLRFGLPALGAQARLRLGELHRERLHVIIGVRVMVVGLVFVLGLGA